MCKFKKGDNVIYVGSGGKVTKGVVETVYPELKSAVVKKLDGQLEKVSYWNLSKTDAQEESKVVTEKAEIILTPDEFRTVSTRVAVEESKKYDNETGLAFLGLCVEIHKALFKGEI